MEEFVFYLGMCLLAVGIFGYLMYVLVKPEKF
ncbi:MAG: potassium-transporting ATPase subunit F [Tannerellaceae bacterium]